VTTPDRKPPGRMPRRGVFFSVWFPVVNSGVTGNAPPTSGFPVGRVGRKKDPLPVRFFQPRSDNQEFPFLHIIPARWIRLRDGLPFALFRGFFYLSAGEPCLHHCHPEVQISHSVTPRDTVRTRTKWIRSKSPESRRLESDATVDLTVRRNRYSTIERRISFLVKPNFLHTDNHHENRWKWSVEKADRPPRPVFQGLEEGGKRTFLFFSLYIIKPARGKP